jgi:hypothetical protein
MSREDREEEDCEESVGFKKTRAVLQNGGV